MNNDEMRALLMQKVASLLSDHGEAAATLERFEAYAANSGDLTDAARNREIGAIKGDDPDKASWNGS
jgi:hypothetical protein